MRWAPLALMPAGAQAGVGVGHSGWYWGNPLPQGVTLTSLEFSGSTGYAGGPFGTLLKTADGGASWAGIATGLTVDLTKVRVVDPNTLVIGGQCSVRLSTNGGQTFARLPFNPSDPSDQKCTSNVAAFSFSSATSGFIALRDGTVVSTADGGKTFSRKAAVPNSSATSAGPSDMVFTDPNTGVAVSTGGQIYRTTDGGGSWTLRYATGGSLSGVYFADANTAYAVGKGGLLAKSVDGGVTWTQSTVDPGTGPQDLTSIRCADVTTCLIATATGNQTFRTADGGTTFTAVTPGAQPSFAVNFAGGTRAVAVGQAGATNLSDDGGVDWFQTATTVAGSFTKVVSSSFAKSTAYAIGTKGSIARTVNSGQSWENIGAPTAADLISVSFSSPTSGFVLDGDGALFKTDNGGSSWAVQNTGTSGSPTTVHVLGGSTVLLVGPRGVRRSTDGGNSFDPVSDKAVSKAGVDFVDRVTGGAYVWGDRALAFTSNGSNYSKVKKLPSRAGLQSVDFTSKKFGYVLDNVGRLYQTKNGGKRWTLNNAIGVNSGAQLSFGDAKNGWIAVAGVSFSELTPTQLSPAPTRGIVLRTNSGGKSFRPQLVAPSDIGFGQLAAFDGQSAFGISSNGVSSGGNEFFATTSGGDQGNASSLSLSPKKSKGKKKKSKRRTIQLNGRLSPAEGGELVQISSRKGSGSWSTQLVTAASNGTFTVTQKITGKTYFVAQWLGDDDRSGAGSSPISVSP